MPYSDSEKKMLPALIKEEYEKLLKVIQKNNVKNIVKYRENSKFGRSVRQLEFSQDILNNVLESHPISYPTYNKIEKNGVTKTYFTTALLMFATARVTYKADLSFDEFYGLSETREEETSVSSKSNKVPKSMLLDHLKRLEIEIASVREQISQT